MLDALAAVALFIQAPSQTPPPSAALSIREWLVSQPFAADTGEDALDRDYLNGEEAAFPEAGRRWRVTAAADDGLADLGQWATRTAAPGAVYACAYLRSVRDASHRLVIASNADFAVWLNGQPVHRRRLAHDAGFQPDTIEVRLAAGWNTLLVKLVNRSDALELGAWLVGDELVVAATRRPNAAGPRNLPAESFTASPLVLSGPLVWRGIALEALTSVRVTPWGPTVPTAALLVIVAADDTLRIDPLPLPGVAMPVTLQRTMDLGSLARAALTAGGARITIVAPGQISEHGGGVAPADVLALLDGRIKIDNWRDADGALEARVVIPAPLAGLTLDLLAAELGPRTRYAISGQSAPWRDGVVVLCSDCREGAALTIRIEKAPGRATVDPPLVRVRDLTHTDAARTAQVLAALGQSDGVRAVDADAWLRAMLDPAKAVYRELKRRDGGRLASLGSRLRSDTILLVGRYPVPGEGGEAWERAWRGALQMQRRFPGATFAAGSAAPYRQLEVRAPALLDSIREAVRRGAWSLVGDWWVDADRGVPSGESLVRRGLYGQREIERLFGRRCAVGWAGEGVGSARSLPQILRGLGLAGLVVDQLRGRDGAGGPLPHDAFLWEGLDGTRIPTYNNQVPARWGDAAALAGALELGNRRTPDARTLLAPYAPTLEMLQLTQDLRRLPAFPALRDAAPEAAFAAIGRTRPAGAWPTWRDDLSAARADRTAIQVAAAWRNRRGEDLLAAAELLATIDSSAYPRAALTAAWQQVLFDQAGDRPPHLPASGSDDAMPAPDSAWRAVRDIRDTALRRLARDLDTRGGGVPIVVFNAASWVRSSYVDLAADREMSILRRSPGGSLRVIDAAHRAAPVRFENDTVRFFAREVPPLGFKVFWLHRGVPPGGGIDAGAARLENDHLLVELDTTTGQLTRVYDKIRQSEALAPGGRGNLLQFFGERSSGKPWVVDSVRAVRRGGNAVERWVEVEQAWNGTRITQRAVLRRDEPFLVVESAVDWRATGALAVAFDFAAAADSAWYEIPYGAIARPTAPDPPAATTAHAGHRWSDLSNADAGVSVLNDGHDGWEADGRRSRLWLLRAPLGPDRPAAATRYHFRYALYPHPGDWRAAGTVRRGIEFNTALLAVREPAHRGPAGRSWSYLTVDADNVYVGAVKRAETARSAVFRLVEWHGRTAQATLTFGRPVTRARTATLLEDPVAGLPLGPNGTLAITLRPWEIVTLLVDQ